MRVVGRERVEAPAAFERLVPVQRRSRHGRPRARSRCSRPRSRAGLRTSPTGRSADRSSRCGRGTARRRSRSIQATTSCERAELAFGDDRVDFEAERQDVGVVLAGRSDRVQLRRGDDEQVGGRGLVGAHPVVGDRQHVVPGPVVVPDEQLRGQLAVGVRRVRVEGATEPFSGRVERGHAAEPTRLNREPRSGDLPMTIW